MGEDISYDYIWNLSQKEKQTNQLLQLSKTFYSDINEYMNKATLTEPQRLNMEKLLYGLFEKRRQKLFLYLAYNKTPPQPLDAIETDFYNQIVEMASKYKIGQTPAQNKSNKLLRSKIDIPEIILPSGKKVGPLKKDEIIDLQGPEADAIYLVNNAICENYNK